MRHLTAETILFYLAFAVMRRGRNRMGPRGTAVCWRREVKIERIFIKSGNVYLCDASEPFGYVFESGDGLWSARTMGGANHGDTYIDRWAAAKQLQLGLGVGIHRDA